MAKRIFISFAAEDIRYRDLLRGQARNKRSPFEFVDMSVKEPWSSRWKTNCRRKIKGCDGMIALISKKTARADGQLWEIACAKQEKVPIRGIYLNKDNKPARVPSGIRIVNWKWDNIVNFLDSL